MVAGGDRSGEDVGVEQNGEADQDSEGEAVLEDGTEEQAFFAFLASGGLGVAACGRTSVNSGGPSKLAMRKRFSSGFHHG